MLPVLGVKTALCTSKFLSTDGPTLTIIPVSVVPIISTGSFDIGSVTRGYVWLVALLSIVHVNVNELSAILMLVPVVNL